MLRLEKGHKRSSYKKQHKALQSNIRPKPEKRYSVSTNHVSRRNTWWFKVMLFNHEEIYCGICKQVIDDINELTIDHIQPLSKGGNNLKSNLQPAHRLCNWGKGNKWPF